MKIIFIFLVALVMPICSPPLWSQDSDSRPFFDLGLSVDYLLGSSVMEIKGWGWKSRLEWPLDSLLVGPDVKLHFDNDKFILNLSYRTNVTDEPGKLKDYDWTFGMLDSLGEVETELTAHLLDANFTWNCVRLVGPLQEKFTLGLGAGYTYQHFDWDAEGFLYQTDYTFFFPITERYGPEKWIAYKINYHLPYLIVNTNIQFEKQFEIELFAKTMLVIANDEDDHVHRKKLSKADYTGLGLSIGGEGRFYFQPDLFYSSIVVQYTELSAEGKEDQRFYSDDPDTPEDETGLEFKNIDAETKSHQFYIGARLGFIF